MSVTPVSDLVGCLPVDDRANPLSVPLTASPTTSVPVAGNGRRRTKAELAAIGQGQRKRGEDGIAPFYWKARGEWYYRAWCSVPDGEGRLKRVTGTARTPEVAQARMRDNRDRWLAKAGVLPASAVKPRVAPNQRPKTGAPTFKVVALGWLEYRRNANPQYDGRIPLSPNAKNSYRLKLENHVLPVFGDRPIDTITRDEIKEFKNVTLPSKVTSRGKLGDSSRTIIDGIIRQVFAWAVEEQKLLTVNPAFGLGSVIKDKHETRKRIDREGLGKKTFIPRRIAEYLTPGVGFEDFTFYDAKRPETKQAQFEKYEHHQVFEARWLLAALGAIRPMEACGLTWDRFTYLFDKKGRTPTVTISQQLYRNPERDLKKSGTKLEIRPNPKTEAGWRTLPLPPAVVEALKDYRKIQDGWKKTVGWQPYDHLKDLVFTTPTGKPRKQQLDSAEWIDLKRCVFFTAKDNDPILETRLYALRHLAITGWVRDGRGTPMEIQKAAGHADISTTIGTYTHLGVDDLVSPLFKNAEAVVAERGRGRPQKQAKAKKQKQNVLGDS